MNVVFFSIIKLFFIVLLGFCLYRKTVLNEESLKFLTFFVINISVPFLFFATILESFDPHSGINVLSFVLLSFAVFIVGLIGGLIFSLAGKRENRREFLSLASFQNGGYLPMNLALFLFAPLMREKFLVYIFLYLIGFNVLMWSAGSFLIFKERNQRFNIRSVLTPPVLSTIIAVGLVYAGWARYVPEFFTTPMRIIGDTAFPFSMIVLGAWLAKSRIPKKISEFKPLCAVAMVKLIVIPALFFIATLKLDIAPLLGLFIVIEASMPSAASLPIVADMRGADSTFISQGVFFTHLIALITVPLWIELYVTVTNFTF